MLPPRLFQPGDFFVDGRPVELPADVRASLPSETPPDRFRTELHPSDFMERFTEAELTAFYALAITNARVLRFLVNNSGRRFIDLTAPATRTALQFLVNQNVLTAARLTAVLTP